MAKSPTEVVFGPGTTAAQTAVLLRARKRFPLGIKANAHNYRTAKEDLMFANNEGHWDDQIRSQRESEGRPCLIINEINPFIRDVIGEQRDSRPNTIVSPVGQVGSLQAAKIIEGYLRNQKYKHKADLVYDTGFAQQLRGGFGYIRVQTEYESDESFNQDIIPAKPVINQLSVVFDPNAIEWHKNDGEWFGLYSHISKEDFLRKYPGVTPNSFDVSITAWYPKGKETFTLLEYFEKEHKKKAIFQLSNGDMVKDKDLPELPEGVKKVVGTEIPGKTDQFGQAVTIVKKRMVDDITIYRYLLCGHAVLEDKKEWPSKYWPVVPIEGDSINIEGKQYLRSLQFAAKDSQRAYNMSRSGEIEMIALAPKAPIIGTPQMFEGFEDQWDTAHKKTYSRLTYNADPMMPGTKPERLISIDPGYIAAIAQSSMLAKQEVSDTIGRNILLPHQPGQTPDISGIALGKYQTEGDISTYIFTDNLERAIEWADLVCVDLIPRILDTEREITIRKIDGTTEEVTINKATNDPRSGNPIVINDMTVGQYSVETNLGPSYQTQRTEQAETMLKLAQVIPGIAAGTSDIIAMLLFQAQGQGAGGPLEEFVKRVKKMLIKNKVLDPTDLKPEELKEFLPVILQSQKLNPILAVRMKSEVAKAANQMAQAEEHAAKAKLGQAQVEQQQIAILGDLLNNMAQMLMQAPQEPGQGQLPGGQGQGQLPGPPEPGMASGMPTGPLPT